MNKTTRTTVYVPNVNKLDKLVQKLNAIHEGRFSRPDAVTYAVNFTLNSLRADELRAEGKES